MPTVVAEIPAAPAWVRWGAALVRRLPVGRYRAIQRLCRRPPPPFRMRMPEELGGCCFRCDLRDSIANEVCFTGRYEPQETALLRAFLAPGMSFVDVGANWGYFTLLAAHQVGRSGRVISLEPDPRLFAMLSDNIARNHLSQVTAFQVAAGSESGSLTLAGFDENGGNFGLSRVVGHAHVNGLLFQVAARPLDAIFRDLQLSPVDLLKMDIEGAEGFALHPTHLIEHGQDPVDIIEQLRHFDYDPWKIDHSERSNRWAAYQKRIDWKQVLQPLETAAPLDKWPHVLFALRGVEPAK